MGVDCSLPLSQLQHGCNCGRVLTLSSLRWIGMTQGGASRPFHFCIVRACWLN
jgi:hypothetical protein